MDEDLLLILSSKLYDIQKGKGNRDGLIQQIVTYVRDGRTVTRKQWVRSEFADHAKKNEEEKKRTMLDEKAKEDKAHREKVAKENEKKANQDKRAKKKQEKEEDKELGHKGRVHHADTDQYKEKLKKIAKENKKDDKKKKDQAQGKEDTKEKKDKKDTRGRYGQADQTKADNKAQDNMIRTDPGKK
jgi:hypothetical protein